MKERIFRYITVSFLLFVVLACNIGPLSIDLGMGGGDDSPADAPGAASSIEAGINAPMQGASLSSGPTEIAYYATSVDGVASVELSVNGEVLSMTSSPDTSEQVVALNYNWTPAVSGSHTIRVRAMDAKGNWSEYAMVSVNVSAPPQAQPDSQTQGQANPPSQDDSDSAQAQSGSQDKDDDDKDSEKPPESDIMELYNVEHDPDVFYYGSSSCGSKKITIETDITNPDDAYAAIIFFRFWDNEGGGLSNWDSGTAMSRQGDDHFSITLESDQITNYNQFDDAVLYYQIKVQSKPPNAEILAGTEVVKEVGLKVCP